MRFANFAAILGKSLNLPAPRLPVQNVRPLCGLGTAAKSFSIRLVRNNTGQTEHIPRRVVRMYSHVDTRFVASGHNAFKEVNEVIEELFVRNVLVRVQKRVKLARGITFVPAGKMQIVGVEL